VLGLPFAIWFTGWYAASLEHTWALALAHLALVLVGFAFFWPLLTPDADRRLPWAAAAAVVFVESVLDAVPGIVLWLRSSLLAPEYWLAVHRPWGRPPLADQQLGGLVYWGIGEMVGLPILLVTVVAWMRADARDAARIDAELDAQEGAEQLRRTGGA
jgi:cytochrome c oxidase assembly factor CtaG